MLGEFKASGRVLFEQSGNSPDRVFVPLMLSASAASRCWRDGPRREAIGFTPCMRSVEFGLGSNMAFRTSVLGRLAASTRRSASGRRRAVARTWHRFLELLAHGYQLAYEPEAITFHSHRDSLAQLEEQVHGYGIGFTAMLTAFLLRNPRHLVGLAAALAPWVRSLRDPASAKQSHRTEELPSGLARAELRGMFAGPFAYLR